MVKVISSFSGDYDFLSNFYFCSVTYEGINYPTLEHAFQAAKSISKKERKHIASLPTPGMAKRVGRKVLLRYDWESVKIGIMHTLLFYKFEHEELALRLIATKDAKLIEGNYWHDNFWGDCHCDICEDNPGLNVLGKLLMEVRESLQESYDLYGPGRKRSKR